MNGRIPTLKHILQSQKGLNRSNKLTLYNLYIAVDRILKHTHSVKQLCELKAYVVLKIMEFAPISGFCN